MPFSVINLRIDERERERGIKYSPLAHERRGEKKRKKNLSFRAACCSIFVTSAVCISARFPSSRQPFFPFREYACSSTTVVSISRPELGCKILEALALKYLWRCTHLRLLILRHHPPSTPSSSLFRSLPDRFSSISSFCSSPPVSSFVWPPFLHPSSSSSSSHLIENRARERVNPRTAGFAWKRGAPSPPIAPNLYPISRDTRVIGEISRRGSFWCALLNRSRWTQEVRKEEGRTILGGMVGSREEGDEEKFIGGMKKCKDGGEGGKRWW